MNDQAQTLQGQDVDLTSGEEETEQQETVFQPARFLAAVVAAAVAYSAAGLLPFEDAAQAYAGRMAAGLTALVAVCWLANVLPLAAASLLPMTLFPVFGVLPIDKTAACYAHPIIWMFFGGFVLALGIERWGLHRRIALSIILRVGAKPSRLVWGFMGAAAILSMWLNNTATTLMLLPIALALINSMSESRAVSVRGEANFAFAMLLGIAYGASIGGVGTPIGTAPNALFFSNYETFLSDAPPLSFLKWMALALPLVLVMTPLVGWLLTHVLAPQERGFPQAQAVLMKEARDLKPMDKAEKGMLYLFGLAAVLWTTRADVNLGSWGFIPGWWNLFPAPSAAYIGDAAVAISVALLAFMIPSGKEDGKMLMDWKTAKTLPWEILFLIGGGIAIAESFKNTGLAGAIGNSIEPLVANYHPIVIIAMVCFIMTFLTEVTSNTAMTSLLLPVLAATAVAIDLDPRLLMLPATLSASCAFMLPIATPPNAIIFASGRIGMLRMARAGIWVNLIGVVLITLLTWFVAVPVLEIDVTGLPNWMNGLP